MFTGLLGFALQGFGLIKRLFSAIIEIAMRYPSQAFLIALLAVSVWNWRSTASDRDQWHKSADRWKLTSQQWQQALIDTKNNYAIASAKAQQAAEKYKQTVEARYKEIEHERDIAIRNRLNDAVELMRRRREALGNSGSTKELSMPKSPTPAGDIIGTGGFTQLDAEVCTINTIKLQEFQYWWYEVEAEKGKLVPIID